MGELVSMTRMLAVARKEVIQLRRDYRSLAMAFLLPLILLILFGYAISWDIRNIKMGVVDQDQSSASREILDSFRSSGYFTLVDRLDAPREIEPKMQSGEIQMALVIPPDFSDAIGSGEPARLQAIVDGSDANTATIVLAYTQAIVQTWSSEVVLEGRRLTLPVTTASRVWYNEELSSRNMIVPGLVAVIMMIIGAMLTSLTIAREWERGTMEQLASTPVSRLEIVLGKLLPYVAIGLIDVFVTSVVGILLFGVPFRGDPFLLVILSFFFLLGALGFGIFLSAIAKSQLLATQLAMITTFLPGFLLSGFMFAIEVMPAPLRALTYLIPARYFLVVTRGIFLKGVGVEVLRIQGLLMIAFAIAGLTMATLVFRKEIG